MNGIVEGYGRNGINLYAQFHFINKRIEKRSLKLFDMILNARFDAECNLDTSMLAQTAIQLERWTYSTQFVLSFNSFLIRFGIRNANYFIRIVMFDKFR